ncbi:cobyrinate a,c-diamide synthase [Alicyclobacillus sp. ALC3]|uniref:cobyrinate a,c-diamide synthase n=1 Tax=Alicyclobacillus sp. ALC3 TaxID=2796143 RepID=UPI002379A51F|nr:cobyrinate a,c-diamide synthase [Alicyclobacillus sp. ALC3]WDL95762.1 cobyrinate a,c-diamide synthase [Alicyclobacillus sp. ALC3]
MSKTEQAGNGQARTEPRPRIVVAGTHSGVGKTTVAIGLMAAFAQSAETVQGFKAGPDYLDASYHQVATNRPARNLDTWMQGKDGVRELFWRASAEVDLSIVEGVMGMFDGKSATDEVGSTAELAKLLDAPVLLVVDGWALARSAAAVVLGFQQFDKGVRLAGVILNRIAGSGHYAILRDAIESACGVPVVGWLPKDAEISLSERHLGLVPAQEQSDLAPVLTRLAETVCQNVDLERVLQVAKAAPVIAEPQAHIFTTRPELSDTARVGIAVARDAAFNFYYAENLELLEWFGAELVEFSPLEGDVIPAGVGGVYIGGGFPEQFAQTLSWQTAVWQSFRLNISAGMPVLAECGGYMALAESITDHAGDTWSMAAVVPGRVQMLRQLAAIGYREVTTAGPLHPLGSGERLRGHEFHASTITLERVVSPAYTVSDGGAHVADEGVRDAALVGGYTHLSFASNPRVAKRFVENCKAFANGTSVC